MTVRRKRLVVGLTGGIACGKSTALKVFADEGWLTLSADLIAADLLASNKSIRTKLVEHFGISILKSCGNIDKEALAGIIFDKNTERAWLEALLHPLIRSRWTSYIRTSPSKKCIIELPLLFENNLQHYFDIVLSVYSPQSTCIFRLSQRGLSYKQSRARIDAQLPANHKANSADHVLWGDGSEAFLNKQVEKFLNLFPEIN